MLKNTILAKHKQQHVNQTYTLAKQNDEYILKKIAIIFTFHSKTPASFLYIHI